MDIEKNKSEMLRQFPVGDIGGAKWKKLIIPGVIVAALLVFGAGFLYVSNAQPTDDANKIVNQPTPTSKVIKNEHLVATIKTGEKWLDQPVKLADLNLFTAYYDTGDAVYTDDDGKPKALSPGDEAKGEYYKVGSDGDKDLILVVAPQQDPSYLVGLIQKTGTNSYSLLVQESPGFFSNDVVPQYKDRLITPQFANSVSVDQKTAYKSLAYQKEIAFKGSKIKNPDRLYDYFGNFSDINRYPTNLLKEGETTDYGKLYTRTLGDGDNFSVQDYILRLPNHTALNYQLRPAFIADDEVPQVTWKNGSVNKDTYRADGIGNCGSAVGLAVLDSTSLEALTEAGTTKAGEKIYEFKDATNKTLKYFYNFYSTEGGEGKVPIAGAFSLAQYRAKHAVFVYQDKLGRLIVFNSTVYGSNAECGKPVVYLYPIKPTDVSVQVGATVTKSEPTYGNGWQVRALPSGDLYWNGTRYDSLFWEGTGDGMYPLVTQGFSVAQKDLQTTLLRQLHQQGLNDKEASDFMEFWLPKMPKTPYVRLTWFGKSDLDRLAPLTVTPRPDTVIRIFLDFAGLNEPLAMATQRLSAPARQGFTVVEWGGLLRSSTAK